jgi:N-acetyl sugar amidotransferase
MDESNPGIEFDAQGQCNCCRDALSRRAHEWWPGDEGRRRMEAMVTQLRDAGRGKPYDAMIGLSGGIDSAYLAHLAVREFGLRVLAVHVDGGWNSEPAVRNIESMVRRLDIDLHTHVIEWQEMRDMQLAFLRASVLNQDIPQDHAFFSTLYRTAKRFGVRYFLSGVNFASESVSPPLQGSPTAIDGTHVRGVHRRLGRVPLKHFPIMGLSEYLWLTRVSGSLTIFKPLNWFPYDKEAAKAELTRLYDWRDYGGKHHESRFTKFYEQIYLPRKYGFDKRRQHLSSLVVAGQLTRPQALQQLEETVVDAAAVRRDIRYVATKLGIAAAELERLLAMPPNPHADYPNQLWIHGALIGMRSWVRRASSHFGRGKS